jgi:hypothetical protein
MNAAFPTNLKLQIIGFGENATAIFAAQKCGPPAEISLNISLAYEPQPPRHTRA